MILDGLLFRGALERSQNVYSIESVCISEKKILFSTKEKNRICRIIHGGDLKNKSHPSQLGRGRGGGSYIPCSTVEELGRRPSCQEASLPACLVHSNISMSVLLNQYFPCGNFSVRNFLTSSKESC